MEDGTKKQPTTTVRFVASSALSLLGNSMAGVVIPLILLARTGDALAAGTLALITLTLPRSVGKIGQATEGGEAAASKGIVAAARTSLVDGVRVLFKDDALLRTSLLLTFGIIMVMASFQGLVLPVHFTEQGDPAGLGYVLSAMSAGLLVGSLGYTALAPRLSKRSWYVVSLVGMTLGVAVLGLLPPYPVMLAAALFLGVNAGPASALLGFFAFDRIPADKRGSALGTQNALVLVVAPVAVFLASVVVEASGVAVGALILTACWFIVTVWALFAKSMRLE